tara:strand:- start:573 stop:1211 length:639 start_codon:yes stop_codon:yes gene_type:complete
MKKVLLIAAVAVFGLTSVQAQDISFGAKAGVNLANLGGDVEDNDMKIGFHVGGVVEIPLSEQFSFAPELLFSTQGTKSEYSETDTFLGETFTYEFEEKLNLSYLNIPLMAKYYVSEGFSLEAGPQVGFLISAKAEGDESVTVDGVTESESYSIDIKDELESLDFGLNFGAGFKMESGLFFQGRYNLGLANLTGNSDVKITNQVIQFSVGFMF